MAVLLTPPELQFFDDDGNPLAGGKVYTYAAGTTTPKATFTTEAGTVENSNPVILDSAGRAAIWISGSYKILVADTNDVPISTTDNVTAFNATGVAANSYFQSFSGNGSQTVFTTSEDLGTDEKAIQVWIDAGGTEGYEIQNPSAYTIDGTSLTFGTAPASGTNNVYVSAPQKLVNAASAAAAAADTSASNAEASADIASKAIGFRYTYSTTTTESDPSSGNLRFNNGTLSSATEVYLSHTTEDSQDIDNYLATWDDSTSTIKTKLRVYKKSDPSVYAIFNVTGAETDNTTWSKFTVAYVDGSGSLANSDIITIEDIRTGDKGDTGAQGPAGNLTNIGSQPSATITASDKIIFADVDDSDDSKNDTVQGILDLVPAPTVGLVPLQTINASTAASVDFTSNIDSTYDIYVIAISDASISNDGVDIWVRLGNGGAFDSGASDYDTCDIRKQADGTSTVVGGSSTGSSRIEIALGVGNGATEGIYKGQIVIGSSQSSTRYTSIRGDVEYGTTSNELSVFISGGRREEAAVHDRVQILPSGGTITGTFTLYGLAGA